MKQKEGFRLGTGTSSILMIFVVLCLTVFGVLSFSTASADQRLTDKALDGVTAYYAADALAEEALAQIDACLAEAFAEPEGNRLDAAARFLQEKGIETAIEDGRLLGEIFIPIEDTRVYRLAFLAGEDGNWSVTARQVKNTDGIWDEEHLNVWDGK